MKHDSLYIIMPAYNEEKKIKDTLLGIVNIDEINEIIEMKNQHNDLSYLNNLDFSKILNKKMLSDKVLKNKISKKKGKR